MIKKCEICRIKYKYCDCFLEYTNFKCDLIEQKCLCCNKNYQHKFDEKLKEQVFNAHTFSNYDNNVYFIIVKRCLLLWIFEWLEKKLIKHYLKKKKNLNMEDISDAEFANAKRVDKDFEKKITRILWFACLKWYIIFSQCIL